MAKKKERRSSRNMSARQWRRMDLHLHTPASNDYHEPRISYLDILRQADVRGLNIIAFTDHNTVAGYRDMRYEIEQLEYLESLGRLEADERRRLESYHKLLEKILILPGFEFTATFGFHILGIFPPETPVSFLEHILLSLNIPLDQLTEGSSTVGASSDVLTAYRLINANGGLVIAAHANSSNGVVMRGLDFGGQTKIAYTQDPNLHCLEVTDLEKRGRYSTRRFFDGSKPEYPRAMRCIQGSDAHRLVRESSSSKHLGVGDRATEILLPTISFDNLKSILSSQDYSLTRPFRGPASPMDFVQVARDEGPSIVQAFHKSMNQRGGHLNRVLEDVCAMANTNGGTIYIGLSSDPKEEIIGVRDTARAINFLTSTIDRRMSPNPGVNVNKLVSSGKTIVRIVVPPGKEVPYAIDDNRFYIRDEAETTLAVRDEIVRLVEHQIKGSRWAVVEDVIEQSRDEEKPSILESKEPETITQDSGGPPRTGVEIVSSEERDGTLYHTVKDLRNGSLINNVSRSSARKLWHYAITQKESGKYDVSKIEWHGNIAVLGQRRRDNYVWYDLAMRDDDGIHVFYGVTDSGLNDRWLALVTNAEK
ncbi:MAG: hypothetical protein BMS9Abin02_0144 [Anaerolineae bacterium]|nr:MAG: hypothetical protein BMS9Abin02_0144 [Anaerolineae bacterium]